MYKAYRETHQLPFFHPCKYAGLNTSTRIYTFTFFNDTYVQMCKGTHNTYPCILTQYRICVTLILLVGIHPQPVPAVPGGGSDKS